MTHRTDVEERYPDALGEWPDPDLVQLVGDLDRAYTGSSPALAPQIDAVVLRALRQGAAARGRIAVVRDSGHGHARRPPLLRASGRLALLVLGSGVAAAAAAAVAAGWSHLGRATIIPGTGPGPRLRSIDVGPSPAAVAMDTRAGHTFVIGHDPVGGDVASLLDTRSGTLLRRISLGRRGLAVGSSAVAVDEHSARAFVITPGSPTIAVLDTRGGALLRRTPLPSARPPGLTGDNARALAVDEGAGRVFVTTFADDTVSALDARSGALLRTTWVGPHPAAIAVDRRARRVFIANTGILDRQGRYRGGGSVSVLDARSGMLLQTIPIGQSPGALAVDTRRNRVFVLDRAGLLLLDARTGAILRTVALRGTPTTVAVDERTGRVFVLVGVDGGHIAVLDARAGAVLRTTPVAPPSTGVETLPNAVAVDGRAGRVLVTYEQDHRGPNGVARRAASYGGLSEFDARSGALVRTVRPPGPGLGALAVDDRASRVVAINVHASSVTMIDGAR